MKCCATLHITVRECVGDRLAEGATVSVAGRSAVTDDTGTVTILVGPEGEYAVHVEHDGGEEDVTVEAECGINNVEVKLGLTDKICVHASAPGEVVAPDLQFEVTDDADAVIGTCTTDEEGECCVDIPGPGTYTVTAVGEGVPPGVEPIEVVIEEDDCGDREVQIDIPGEFVPCDRHVHVELCGCVAVGVTIEVVVEGVTVSGTTDANGDATLTMSADICDSWVGSAYTLLGTGITGTITAEPMEIDADTDDDRWCLGGDDPCFDELPDTITATFTTYSVRPELAGKTITLHRDLLDTFPPWDLIWTAGCQVIEGEHFTFRLAMSDNVAAECEQNLTGYFEITHWNEGFCEDQDSFPIGFYISNDESSICPFALTMRDTTLSQGPLEVTA